MEKKIRSMAIYVLCALIMSSAWSSSAMASETSIEISQKESNRGTLAYIQQMREKYGDRLRYASAYGKDRVAEFNIDCHAPDGRYLPLENLLLARLSSMEQKSAWSISRVENRGEDVKIYDETIKTDGRSQGSTLVFELNSSGELKPVSMRASEVLSLCQGGMGQIWMLPE